MWWLIIPSLFIFMVFVAMFTQSTIRPEPLRASIIADLQYLRLGYNQVSKLASEHSDCSTSTEIARLLVEAAVIIGLVEGLVETGKLEAMSSLENLQTIRARLDDARSRLTSARRLQVQCCQEKQAKS